MTLQPRDRLPHHGGRRLDRAPIHFEQLPAIAQAIGDTAEALIDGGVLTALRSLLPPRVALARSSSVGAYLYGLMAGGKRGVAAGGYDPNFVH
jgi:L-lactate dehydrogenase (cytochrome)